MKQRNLKAIDFVRTRREETQLTFLDLRIVTPMTAEAAAMPINPSRTRRKKPSTLFLGQLLLHRNNDRRPTLSKMNTREIATAK